MSKRRDVDAAINAMASEHLQCRDVGHHWRPWDAYRLPRGRGYDQRMRCGCCATVRHRVLDRTGDVIRQSYRYPDGYLVDGVGRLTGADRGTLRIRDLMIGGTLRETPDE